MFQLKSISKESVPGALDLAERYRLLNEPGLAESICIDILDADPGNAKAHITMLLAITDQFATGTMDEVNRARYLLSSLNNEYERQYYEGIICERKGNAIISKGDLNARFLAYDWIQSAMEHYEKAESIRPANNDNAILRWNTCARLIMHYQLEPKNEELTEPPLE